MKALRDSDPQTRLALADWKIRYRDWLLTAALPLWWTAGADRRRGGFHEVLTLDGQPPPPVARRARVQARQAFSFMQGRALGWSGPAQEAARHAIDYLIARFQRPDGQFRTLVDADGNALDDTAMLYDQAFALLAMCVCGRIFGLEQDMAQRAEALLHAICRGRRHDSGGFVEAGAQPFVSNPHMHLLEAALAWAECNGATHWEQLADELVTLACERFIDSRAGFLREYFTAAWEPAEGDLGHVVEPGHQFEWSWLLARWARRRNSGRVYDAAVTLFKSGEHGVDAARHVAMDELADDLAVRSFRARLWPQTERLKAALLLGDASASAKASYEAAALDAAEGLWRYLDTSMRGLWHDKLGADDTFLNEPAPASSFYHIVGAIAALNAHIDRPETVA